MPIDLLCGDCKNTEDLNHYLYDYIPHFGGRLHFDVSYEAHKKEFHALKNLNDSAVARANIPNRLERGRQIASAKV